MKGLSMTIAPGIRDRIALLRLVISCFRAGADGDLGLPVVQLWHRS